MTAPKLILLFGLVVAVFGLSEAALSPPARAEQVPQSQAQIDLSFAPLVRQAAPAVVNVYAERIQRQQGYSPFGADPFFRRFFGGDGFFGAPRERVAKSLGSGVIVDDGGFIVTNHHVIANASEIKVVLHDKREFEAKVLVDDERTDLAILKVDPDGKKLPFLELGDSDGLEVGDLVLAIGNPFGVGQTVTSGIVSALARTQVGVSDYQFFIQTDAAINPGNSGGALIDMSGRLVGINTAIYSRGGGSVGIGFAIPVNMVRSVIYSVRDGGKIVRPWLGVGVQEVTADIADTLGMNRPYGALVVQVHPDSPLARAGIKRGSVIVAVNGKPINSAKELEYRVATARVGDTAKVSVLEGRQKRDVSITLIAPPETTPRAETLIEGPSPFAGLKVANLSPAVADELHLPQTATGVVVVGVAADGPARRVGFRPGDIVLAVNGIEINRVKQLAEIAGMQESYWQFAINRGGRVLRMRMGG